MKTKQDHEHGLNGRAHLNGARAVEEPTVSIVIPTRNEIANIEALLTRLAKVIPAGAEVIFVDDSDDTTAYRVRQLAKADGYVGPEIRLLHRPVSMRSGGLGTAVTEGLRMARARWVCVLDADLQHPPEMVSRMVEQGERTESDLVVATRYGTESSNEGLSGTRRLMSRACALAAKSLLSNRLRGVSDPLSGFFLVRRNAIDVDRLHPNGFKILLEIIGRHPDLRTTEVGYSFSERYAGLSKASVTEARRYAAQLLSLSLSQHGGAQNNTILARAKPALYDVHGIITVASAYRLPELEKFRVQQLSAPAQIVVRALDHAASGFIDLDHTVPLIRYQEQLGRAGFIVEVELGEVTTASVSTLVAKSPHVLYTNVVEPILRWAFVERGYALVHAACFARDGEAFFITARTDTGKTTTMLKILDKGTFTFLSDDLSLVDRNGRVLTYPKPLTISHHTVHALQSAELGPIERFFLPLQSRLHSRAGRRFAFLIASQRFPVASLNAAVQWLVPPPKYHVERLVPGVKGEHSARLSRLFVIERSDHESIDEVAADVALEIVLANCDDAYGFPPYESLETILRFQGGTDLRERERATLAAALANTPSQVIRSATMGWAETIADLIEIDSIIDLRESVPVS